ncbi:MAG: hypothetical protein M3Y33_20965 [Actinomycetota bacterium]|nr:hypothetical protein [Actinomycetota bacterium]
MRTEPEAAPVALPGPDAGGETPGPGEIAEIAAFYGGPAVPEVTPAAAEAAPDAAGEAPPADAPLAAGISAEDPLGTDRRVLEWAEIFKALDVLEAESAGRLDQLEQSVALRLEASHAAAIAHLDDWSAGRTRAAA